MRETLGLQAGARQRYPVRFDGPEIHYDLSQPRPAPDPLAGNGRALIRDYLAITWPDDPNSESHSLRRFLERWGPVWEDLATRRTLKERAVWRPGKREPDWVPTHPNAFQDQVLPLRSIQDDLHEWQRQITGAGELIYTKRHLPPLTAQPLGSRKRHLRRLVSVVNDRLDSLSVFARVTDAGELEFGLRSMSLVPYLYLALVRMAPFAGIADDLVRGACPNDGRPVIWPQRKFCTPHCQDAYRKRRDYRRRTH